jgi:formyl-CoA transferase
MQRILDGIRILDLSRVLAGPWATQCLADLGAEVIKIERPGQGDDTRRWGPPFLKDRDGRETSDAAYFLAANRGKRSVTLDISLAEGQEIARRLAALSDVVVENFKVGDLARYGLDYASLSAGHERLIYCSITGFGQDGPYRDRPGYDFMIQGLGGLMSVTGERDDLPGGGPQKVGVAVADLFTGMYAANAIVASLLHRERTGQGQSIDIALLDAQVAMLANLGAAYLASGRIPGRMGNAHQAIVPYQVFRASDRYLIVAVGNDAQFTRLCEVLDLASLSADSRYVTNPARVAHRDELVARIAEKLAQRPAADWLAALEGAQVPCGPINDLEQALADPQVLHRGMVATLSHPAGGEVRMVANPVQFSATSARSDVHPPTLGEHTDAVLGELLGLTESERKSLKERKVI